MVVGHTIQGDLKIQTRCQGSIVLADTGIEKCYGGRASYLIHRDDGTADRVYVKEGVKEKLPKISRWSPGRKKQTRQAFLQVLESPRKEEADEADEEIENQNRCNISAPSKTR